MRLTEPMRQALADINSNRATKHTDVVSSLRKRGYILLGAGGSFSITPSGLQALEQSNQQKSKK